MEQIQKYILKPAIMNSWILKKYESIPTEEKHHFKNGCMRILFLLFKLGLPYFLISGFY